MFELLIFERSSTLRQVCVLVLCRVWGRAPASSSESKEFHARAAKEDVRRIQVAMDDLVAVQLSQALSNLAKNLNTLRPVPGYRCDRRCLFILQAQTKD